MQKGILQATNPTAPTCPHQHPCKGTPGSPLLQRALPQTGETALSFMRGHPEQVSPTHLLAHPAALQRTEHNDQGAFTLPWNQLKTPLPRLLIHSHPTWISRTAGEEKQSFAYLKGRQPFPHANLLKIKGPRWTEYRTSLIEKSTNTEFMIN